MDMDGINPKSHTPWFMELFDLQPFGEFTAECMYNMDKEKQCNRFLMVIHSMKCNDKFSVTICKTVYTLVKSYKSRTFASRAALAPIETAHRWHCKELI